MDRRKIGQLKQRYGAAVLCLTVLCAGLYTGISRTESETARLRAGNEAAEAFSKRPIEPRGVYGSGDNGSLQRAAEAARKEIILLESSEEMPSAMSHGDVHTLRLTGTGSFNSLLRAFDAIHAEGSWLTAGVRRIERTGDTLQFELEISEYRERK